MEIIAIRSLIHGVVLLSIFDYEKYKMPYIEPFTSIRYFVFFTRCSKSSPTTKILSNNKSTHFDSITFEFLEGRYDHDSMSFIIYPTKTQHEACS